MVLCKTPDASNSTDSIIIGAVLTGGVFAVPFDCRYAASYSRVLYTGAELGVSTTEHNIIHCMEILSKCRLYL